MRDRSCSVFLLLTGAFGPTGGIEMYNRLVVRAFQEILGPLGIQCHAYALMDTDGQFDERYLAAGQPRPVGFSGNRRAFALRVLADAAIRQPKLIVSGHVNFAPLILALRGVAPRSRQWVLTHGIDVWGELSRTRRTALHVAHRILSVSDYTRRQLRERNGIGEAKLDLLPDALDPVWAAECAERRERLASVDEQFPTLLTVARLARSERYKGVDQVIRALPRVAASFPELRYQVVGKGDDVDRLRAVASEVGVSERVGFPGYLTPDDLALAYATSSLFVMPSAKEGFGIVFLEAALFGRAAIAGRHGGSPEVVADGETGRLVEYGNVSELESVLLELLGDRPRLASLGRAAQLRLEEKFTYAAFRSNLERILETETRLARA